MVILKKLKSSTLMETLVATVIIIVIFIVASMILNAVFFNSYKSNTNEIENHFKELEYKIYSEELPSQIMYNYQDWEISVKTKDSVGIILYEIKAKNDKTKKEVKKVVVKK
jgi:flagellar basal body-associated protein FliL